MPATHLQILEPCQKIRCEFLLYILVTLHTPGVVVFPEQQHLPHCLLITPERAGVQSLIRCVIVGVVQGVAAVFIYGVVKRLEANIMVQTGTSESVYGGYISFPAAYTSPENVTQEIAEDVYAAFERFLKDNVFPPDDAWRTVAETEWYVVPQDFGVYRANLDIWMPSEEYGTMHYELSGLVTFFNTQGNYSVSDFRIEVDC